MDISRLKELQNKVEINKKLISDIKDLSDKINVNDNNLALVEKSIANEKYLKTFPSQAIGSISLYNRLNENFTFYDESQFNKIIRFVDYMERKEKLYRDLYVECTRDYVKNPNGIPLGSLYKEREELNVSYKLLTVLVDEVNGDVVSFNKVYNKLEDSGFFMTIPEKQNQKYLSEISSKLSDVMLGLKVIFESLEETNKNLRDISENTSVIADITYDNSSILWDISWNLDNNL